MTLVYHRRTVICNHLCPTIESVIHSELSGKAPPDKPIRPSPRQFWNRVVGRHHEGGKSINSPLQFDRAATDSASTGTSGNAITGNNAHTANANGWPTAPINPPNNGGAMPAVRSWLVFCVPSARPLQDGPAISPPAATRSCPRHRSVTGSQPASRSDLRYRSCTDSTV
jgi:hypothetical protein